MNNRGETVKQFLTVATRIFVGLETKIELESGDWRGGKMRGCRGRREHAYIAYNGNGDMRKWVV